MTREEKAEVRALGDKIMVMVNEFAGRYRNPLPQSWWNSMRRSKTKFDVHIETHEQWLARSNEAYKKWRSDIYDVVNAEHQEKLRDSLKLDVDPELLQQTAATRVKELQSNSGLDILETALKATKLSTEGLRSSVLQLFSGMDGERRAPMPGNKAASTLSSTRRMLSKNLPEVDIVPWTAVEISMLDEESRPHCWQDCLTATSGWYENVKTGRMKKSSGIPAPPPQRKRHPLWVLDSDDEHGSDNHLASPELVPRTHGSVDKPVSPSHLPPSSPDHEDPTSQQPKKSFFDKPRQRGWGGASRFKETEKKLGDDVDLELMQPLVSMQGPPSASTISCLGSGPAQPVLTNPLSLSSPPSSTIRCSPSPPSSTICCTLQPYGWHGYYHPKAFHTCYCWVSPIHYLGSQATTWVFPSNGVGSQHTSVSPQSLYMDVPNSHLGPNLHVGHPIPIVGIPNTTWAPKTCCGYPTEHYMLVLEKGTVTGTGSPFAKPTSKNNFGKWVVAWNLGRHHEDHPKLLESDMGIFNENLGSHRRIFIYCSQHVGIPNFSLDIPRPAMGTIWASQTSIGASQTSTGASQLLLWASQPSPLDIPRPAMGVPKLLYGHPKPPLGHPKLPPWVSQLLLWASQTSPLDVPSPAVGVPKILCGHPKFTILNIPKLPLWLSKMHHLHILHI
ncbi:hypothetical protein BU15DRAFT_68500 [Melanogaster broomeanus]|nr:hypothetical protein BU15DRAFT_68500 [Melanogaster broomeanus]